MHEKSTFLNNLSTCITYSILTLQTNKKKPEI